MSRQVYIHIGPHKTATRLLRWRSLSQLDPERYAFNPQPLYRCLNAYRLNPEDPERRDAFHQAVRDFWENDHRSLVISNTKLSGKLYDRRIGIDEGLQVLQEAFENPRIIYFVRNQADWLQSVYKQTTRRGPCVPFNVFLNYYDGEFRDKPTDPPLPYRTMEPLQINFLDIYQRYARAFGPENIYLFRQEDLRTRPQDVYDRLADALDVDELPTPPKEKSTANRAYSAFAMTLLCPWIHRHPSEPPRPWLPEPVRKAIQPVVKDLRRNLRGNLIRFGIDRWYYWNWDLLEQHSLRQRIEDHFAEENATLKAIADTVLESGPERVPQLFAEKNLYPAA